MSADHVERRRTRRVTSDSGLRVTLDRRTRVRVVDLSAGGALIAPEEPLPVGTVGILRFTLGGRPMEARLEVLRTHRGSEISIVPWVGGIVTTTDARHREVLEQFLMRAEES